MATNAPWSIFWGKGGWTKSYLSMYLLYIVFLSFSHKIFSLTRPTFARLRCILNLQMQACNVFYQLHLYIFFHFLVSLSLTARFQSSLKTRIKLHKIAYKVIKCPNIVCGCGVGGGWGVAERGEDVKMGEERHRCWGDRCPWIYCGYGPHKIHFWQTIFEPIAGVLPPEIFTRATDWPSLDNAHPNCDGCPPKKNLIVKI